jgi:hypothetical protein
MLVCETAVFICSILMVVWDIGSDGTIEGYEDMAVYTVPCSIATFFALIMTLSLLLVPTHVRSCSSCDILLTLNEQKQEDAAEFSLGCVVNCVGNEYQRYAWAGMESIGRARDWQGVRCCCNEASNSWRLDISAHSCQSSDDRRLDTTTGPCKKWGQLSRSYVHERLENGRRLAMCRRFG